METAHLEYEQRGTGPAVYLVHAGVHSSWFAPLFREPSLDRFRVIRPIRPGYGDSPAPPESASLAAHSRACGRLLQDLGVGGAYWVGHSSSCCIGLQLALDQPELVAGLVLYEPAKPSGQMREANAASYVTPAMAAAAKGDIAGAFDVWLRGVGGDGYRTVLRETIGETGIAAAERESAYFFADELPAVGVWQFGSAEAAQIGVPVLVVRGARSKPWFAENVALLTDMLPNARPLTLEGADHLAPLTHAADLAAVIADFVSACSGAGARRPA